MNLISHSLCWSGYSCPVNTPRSVALVCQCVITLRCLLICAREGRNLNKNGEKRAGLNLVAERVDRCIINLLTLSHTLSPMFTVTPRSIFLLRCAQSKLEAVWTTYNNQWFYILHYHQNQNLLFLAIKQSRLES